MPTSKKQIKSNRQNAKKSTGPRTNEGKEIASRNATKHGLYARDLIINSPHLKESKKDFYHLVKSLCDDFLPVGDFEKYLVEKIANALWRSRRAPRAEAATINRQIRKMIFVTLSDPDTTPEEQNRDDEDKILEYSLPFRPSMMKILHYERRLDLQLSRSYALLICLQSRRKSDMVENIKAGKLKYGGTNPAPDNENDANDLKEILKISD
jgi:hypothetical protein